MSSTFNNVISALEQNPKKWLVTGCAGFIGSHLIEFLLSHGQHVTGLDNFATGYAANVENVKGLVGDKAKLLNFIEGDIKNLSDCQRACVGVDYVLHQAALGSVPRSIDDPLSSHQANVDGFVNMLIAAKDNKIKRFVFASSSSVYGDSEELPKIESKIGNPLSPYAVTKLVNELYAFNFSQVYRMETIGLRYFNVFGPRQDPNGAYAAVIPRWIDEVRAGKPSTINGDGETSRDFCYVANVVQANVLAAVTTNASGINKAYNVAVGGRTTLNQLYQAILTSASETLGKPSYLKAVYGDFRAGDVRHSLADISAISSLLGYQPTHEIKEGIKITVDWFLKQN